MKPKERLIRKEVPVEQTWDLTDLFSNDEKWEEAFEQLKEDTKRLTEYEGILGENAQTLFNCIQSYEELQEKMGHVATYAGLKVNSDGTDSNYQGDYARVLRLFANLSSQLSFIESEILQIEPEKITTFLHSYEPLRIYEKFLMDLLEKRPHTLQAEIEQVLASLEEIFDAPYTIYQRSKLSDMEFEPIVDHEDHEHPMSFALYEDQYEISEDHYLRHQAYQSFTRTLNQYKNTFAAIYNTEVTKQVTLANIRNYDSVIDMLLEPQQVTREMYERQLDIIQKELAPHMRKYAQLKQRVLGLDQMKFCDLQVSLDPDFQPQTSYKEAVPLIIEALSIMGPEYKEIIEKAFHNRWIDYADNVGKSTGAFCSSPYGAHPYILMTWTNTMRGAFILAHELGHAGHFYLAGANQSLLNTRPSMYFIEAPSTLNELLLADYLFKQTEDVRMKRWIIDQLLGTYYHNFVTHLLEGEFQRRVYQLAEEGIPLTENILTKQKQETLEDFWGDVVEIDQGASLTWMRQPHYYMGLYPYTYSSGLTIATEVAGQIRKEGDVAVNRWLEVLKAGGTLKPLQLAELAGVDLRTADPIHRAVDYVGSLIDELEKSFE